MPPFNFVSELRRSPIVSGSACLAWLIPESQRLTTVYSSLFGSGS